MLPYESLSEVDRARVDRIRFLEAQNTNLAKENQLLKAALTRQTLEAERRYDQNIDKFDQVSRMVMEEIIYLVKIHKRAVSYDEIVKAFQSRHPNVAKTETITRRVRELREQGVLSSPVQGTFVPI